MRKLRVDRMMKNLARQTPDYVLVVVDRDYVLDEWITDLSVFIKPWTRLITLKHEKNPSYHHAEIFNEFDIDYNRYRIGIRAVFKPVS